ncbi:MAG TPA: GntR family transcriptional regulator [Candidatus Avisuccinivibrio pullicola]|nr:GntR family transcriptional regulator [Candidatus Avisuccinivibrio pullicola]
MHRQEHKLAKLRLTPERPISAQIYDFLRSEITTTAIQPGALISENELSAHFNVSRQPIREALMRLRLDGLLTVMPQRGSIVEKISVSNLKQICFLRSAIECAAVENATEISDTQLDAIVAQLEQNVARQREVVTEGDNVTRGFLNLDDEFHRLVTSLSTCPMAWDNIQSLKPQMDRIRYLSQGEVSPYALLIDDHARICAALKARDFAAARQHLHHHLHEIMETYVAIREQYAQWFCEEEDGI